MSKNNKNKHTRPQSYSKKVNTQPQVEPKATQQNAVVAKVTKQLIQSRDQLRAKHALNAVESLKNGLDLIANNKERKSVRDKIKSAISGLPAMIHTNGLGHAFAFFLSDIKNFPERQRIVEIVFDWLSNESKVFEKANLTPLSAITKTNLQTYQIAQQEAQAYLLWLKKFARAILTDDKGE